MSSKFNKYGSSIKKSYTNSINIQQNKVDKKSDKNPSSKRLTGLFIGLRSNALQGESKSNQEEISTGQNQIHRPNNLDEPAPETLGQYYEERKKIIFGDLIDNESLIKQLILKTQIFMNQEYNKKKSSFFGEKNTDIYNKMLNFKETISNYCLIIHLYLKKNQNKKAFELFLLMCSKNKVIIEYFYKKIQEQLPKISNSNRIGKFFPSITKLFIQLLSCFIKLSGKFSKSRLQTYYIKYYLKTIYIVSDTVINRFGGVNNVQGMDSDIKHIGRYFYRNCIFDAAIFFFMKYQPLIISNFILQHILELYQDKSFTELLDVEQVLLLKVNYNLGLFLYADGNNIDAISYLNQAKERLSDIKFLPLTKEKKEKPYNIIQSGFSNEQIPILSKLTYNNKRFGSFLNNEEIKRSSKNLFLSKINNNNINTINSNNNTKDLNDNSFLNFNKNNILRTSGSSFMDLSIKKYSSSNKNKVLLTLDSETKDTLPRKSSGVLFGNQIMTLQQQCENVEEKIYNEIELILGEIEITQKNYKEALIHLKKLLPPTNNQNNLNSNNIYQNRNRNKFIEEQNQSYQNRKESDTNYCNYKLLTDSDKRRIMALLSKIDHAYDNNESNYEENELSNKFTNYYYLYKNNNIIERKKYINSKEMEKFFIFICSLSVYQLKILNESQPSPSDKRNDLPIIFNNQFKDCLTNAQRMSLTLLESMSLTRYIILKDTNQDICPENLDFRFMKYRIKDTDIDYDNENNKIYKKKSKNRRNTETNNTQDISNANYYKINNTTSSKIKTKNDFEEDDFENILNIIKNEENKDFIEEYKNSILQVLLDLDKEEQKIFLNSKNMLKKLIKKLKNGMIQKEKNN
jgi:hypothetical protein